MTQRTRSLSFLLMTLAMLFLISACSTTPSTTAEPEPIDLSGDWMLNHELSDSPSDVLKVRSKENGFLNILQTIGGAFRIYGISARDVFGMLPRRKEDDPLAYHSHVTDSRLILNVLQAEDSMQVKYDRAGTEVYWNGETTHEAEEMILSYWEEDAYVVARWPRNALPIMEIFELSEEGDRLHWTIVVENPKGKEVEITRIYDVLPEGPETGQAS